MKIIRPEQPQKQDILEQYAEPFKKPLEINVGIREQIIDEPQSIEDIMNDVINNGTKNITFTITLTKRQYDLYLKKGGEVWLKKALVGQAKLKKRKLH